MVKFNQRQRALIAEKVCDTANLAVGALLFGQFLGDTFYAPLAIIGLVVWLALMFSGA